MYKIKRKQYLDKKQQLFVLTEKQKNTYTWYTVIQILSHEN